MSLSRSERHQQKRKSKRRKKVSLGLIFSGAAIVIIGAALSLGGAEKMNDWLESFWSKDGETVVDGSRPSDGKNQAANGSIDDTGSKNGSNRPGEDGAGTDPEAGDEDHAASNDGQSEPGDSASEGAVGFSDADTVSLSFVGDIVPGEYLSALMEQQGYDYPYRQALLYLSEPDITAGNLEIPITTRGTPITDQPYVYKGSPDALPALRDAGFNVLSLANNHAMDQGVEGMLDTIRHLDEAGLAHMGTGNNDKEAFAPHYEEAKGIKVAYIGLSRVIPLAKLKADRNVPGIAESYDTARAVSAIQEAKEAADIVVVMVHWGLDGKDTPEQYQRDLAKVYIDAGADLIIGSHPHVLQGFEMYKGKWIAYSLGNFVFTAYPKDALAETGVLDAACNKDGNCELTFNPMKVAVGQPSPMESEEADALFKRLTSISFGATLDGNGTIRGEDQGEEG